MLIPTLSTHSPSLSHLDHHQGLDVLVITVQLFNIRGLEHYSDLTREVIRSRYISSTLPDMTRVTVRLDPQPRVERTYTCTVTVEGRILILLVVVMTLIQRAQDPLLSQSLVSDYYVSESLPLCFPPISCRYSHCCHCEQDCCYQC